MVIKQNMTIEYLRGEREFPMTWQRFKRFNPELEGEELLAAWKEYRGK